MKNTIKIFFEEILYIIIYLFITFLFWEIEHIIDFNNFSKSYFFTAVGALAGFFAVRKISKIRVDVSIEKIRMANVVIAILTGIFLNCFIGTLFETVVFHKPLYNVEYKMPTVLSVFYTVTVAPFSEEYIFRKCAIDPVRYSKIGIILNTIFFSAFFAFMHSFTDVSVILIAFVSAIVYSILYIITKEFCTIVLIHTGFNIMSAIDSILRYNNNYITCNIYVMIICAVLFFVCSIYLIKNHMKRSDS